MPSPTQENIAIVFENYFHSRSKVAQDALNNARQFGKVMSNRVCLFSFYFCYAVNTIRLPALLTSLEPACYFAHG
jgi:hypothetical protein